MLCLPSRQADSKLREEEKRALRYLETRRDCNSVQAVSVAQGSSGELRLSFSHCFFFLISHTHRLDISPQKYNASFRKSGPVNVLLCVCVCALSQQLMECCVNALVTSFKETILAECPGMIKRNETESEYGRIVPTKGSASSGLRQEIALTQTSPHYLLDLGWANFLTHGPQ